VPASTGSENENAKSLDDEGALKAAIDKLELPPDAAEYLNGRYLAYTRFCEDQATKWRIGYYWLRIPAITLAAFVPALVAANLGLAGRLVATGLGVVIAALSAVEHFLNAGGRWRHYRGTVECLKSEGWAYLALASPYTGTTDHPSALPSFVDQVERVIRADVGDYVALVDTDAHTSANQKDSITAGKVQR
jgi:DNA-binding transcriptional LysR family regulator